MSHLHWIAVPAPGRLAIAPRPRAEDGLDGEIAGWNAAGVQVVVCLLPSAEMVALGLQREAALCAAAAMEFVSFPIQDFGVPGSIEDTATMVGTIAGGVTAGRSIAVHCRGGIGRSSTIAACVLICLGVTAQRALELIAAARGIAVPETPEQRDWVLAFETAWRSDHRS